MKTIGVEEFCQADPVVEGLLFLSWMSPESLETFSKMYKTIDCVQGSLDVPGARWPGAVMAKAFMIHGLRAVLSVVDPIVIAVGL